MKSSTMRNLAAALAVASCDGFSVGQAHSSTVATDTRVSSMTPLHMSGFPQTEEDISVALHQRGTKKRPPAELSAVAIGTVMDDLQQQQEMKEFFGLEFSTPNLNKQDSSFLQESFLPVVSTSFLITANTVGASCLVLPEMAAGPGFGIFTGVSLLTYVVNLVSGLLMAEVAIQQYESSGTEGSSSFKDFAHTSFQNPLVSNGIACVSILTNAAILAFTFGKAGELGSDLLGGAADPATVSVGFVAFLGVMLSSWNGEQLSNVASVCVAGLFLSFAGLLLPGLAAVQDPMALLTSTGVADAPMAAATQAFPILLLSLVYQNIVPSVTKILDYDRRKTTASLALGSFIPLAMYLAWCYVGLGGGIDSTGTMAGPLLTGFTMATVMGSSVGTTMSVAEEFDSFFQSKDKKADPAVTANDGKSNQDIFSVPAVAAAIAVPMIGTVFGGDDMIGFLGLAGSIGTPLLYGLVPALMAWKQRQESEQQRNLVPGGLVSLGALGLASTGFVGQELAHVVEQAAAVAT